jgi:hypothetical protein
VAGERIGVAALCCLALAGCGAGERDAAAAAAAEDFLTALATDDAAAACASLSSAAADGLAADAGECEAAIASLGLPTAPVQKVDVWGDRAQVRTGDDVLFLSLQSDGWKVDAAGCRPQGERPYAREVGGR